MKWEEIGRGRKWGKREGSRWGEEGGKEEEVEELNRRWWRKGKGEVSRMGETIGGGGENEEGEEQKGEGMKRKAVAHSWLSSMHETTSALACMYRKQEG